MSLMGIDIGSSTCKAAVYAEHGVQLASGAASYKVMKPEPGRFELDCVEVEQAVFSAIRQAADVVRTSCNDPITAISIGSFGEAVVPIDRNGTIIGNSIFSHDDRSKDAIARLEQKGRDYFYRINANVLGYSYTYPKLVWYKEQVPELHARIWKVLTWSDFIVYRLTGNAGTNFSLASRTLLFDVRKEQWSDELIEMGRVDKRILADVVPPGTVMGNIRRDMASMLHLDKDVTIVVGGHDQCINALGAGAVDAGDSVTGIGTVECTTVVFDPLPDLDMLHSLNLGVEHHVVPGKYVAFIHNQAGALQTWFMHAFCTELQKEQPDERAILDLLTNEAPSSPTDLLFLPFVEPAGAPMFLPANLGTYIGMGATTGRGELYRALLEGETFFFVQAFEKLQQHGIKVKDIIATGGGSRSDVWLQIKADMFNRAVRRARYRESGTAGAAIAAGLSTGVYDSVLQAVQAFKGSEQAFTPDHGHVQHYERLYKKYQRALEWISK
ncbi:MAG: hypothetical protein GX104_02815, partial [Spirochaetales bacterium]|nr:hypothetical protein [Spirochaetales bacterium]